MLKPGALYLCAGGLWLSSILQACGQWNPPPFAPPEHLAQSQEFGLNPNIQGNQLAVRLDMNETGQAVVSWSSQHDTGLYQVYAQRYSPTGQKEGEAILVASQPNADHYAQAVSIGPQGEFLVAWTTTPTLQRGQSVYIRQYNAQGQPHDEPLLIEFVDTYESLLVDAALTPDGGFVVSWARSFETLSDEILLQAFDPEGRALNEPVRVNTYRDRSQSNPALSVDAQGRIIVVWESMGQDGSATGIYGQRFDASVQPVGAEFQVHQSTESFQVNADLAHDARGNFMVVWSSEHPVSQFFPSANHIFARRFNHQAQALGPEFKVSSNSSNAQYPAIAMNKKGQAVIAWEDADGGGAENVNDPLLDAGIYARRYDAQGSAQTAQFTVNQHVPFVQQNPAVGLNGIGRALLAWSSDLQDGDALGVFAIGLRQE